MRAPILLLGLVASGLAGSCNKNKHCNSGEFCYSSANSCSNRNCDCHDCDDYNGAPGFTSGTQNCQRYENICGGDCTKSAPAPTRRPTPRPVAVSTPRPTARPTRRPTQRPTRRPTQRPTPRPTPRPIAAGSPTPRPAATIVYDDDDDYTPTYSYEYEDIAFAFFTSCGALVIDFGTCMDDATPPYEDWVRWPGGSGTSYSYVLNPGDDELWADDDGARGIGAEPLPLADGVATCGDVEADPAFRDRCWTQLPQMVQGCGPAWKVLMTCWYETEARVRGGLDCALTCPPAPPPTPAPPPAPPAAAATPAPPASNAALACENSRSVRAPSRLRAARACSLAGSDDILQSRRLLVSRQRRCTYTYMPVQWAAF